MCLLMRFLCDQMLGRLARWLRFLGFDTFYANNEMADDELLDIAKREERVLITRDKELVFRCRKHLIPFVHIQTDNIDEQLLFTVRSSDAVISDDDIFSRCSECNALLEKIKKDAAEQMVPKRVFEQHDDFLQCPQCKNVYWAGTHTDNIMEKISWLKKSLGNY